MAEWALFDRVVPVAKAFDVLVVCAFGELDVANVGELEVACRGIREADDDVVAVVL